MQFVKLLGETVSAAVFTALRGSDGSWIAVQTEKPSMYAGETVNGWVVVQLFTARPCDRVLMKITCKEVVYWDEEISRSVTEGEGENAKTRTVYEHHARAANEKWLKDIVVVSQVPHTLLPGLYKYPFSYKIPDNAPGCARWSREQDAADPEWRRQGRKLRMEARVVYNIRAIFDVPGGIFTANQDIKCKQEWTVNSAFDWSKMRPAHGDAAADVRLLCCIPRGHLSLSADFDKAAYAGGETAQIKAQIFNQSKENVQHMVVKLMRFIELTDASGRKKTVVDTVAQASYPGVEKLQARPTVRDLPLQLRNDAGALLPCTRGRKVGISYRFDVECDITCAPDIEVHLPIVIYQPAPAVWGLAAMGIALPPDLGLPIPQMPVMQPPPLVQPMMQPQQPMMQPQQPMMQPQQPMMQVQVQQPVMQVQMQVPQQQPMMQQPQQPMMQQPQPQMGVQMQMGVGGPGMGMGVSIQGGGPPQGAMVHQGSFHGGMVATQNPAHPAMAHQGSFHSQVSMGGMPTGGGPGGPMPGGGGMTMNVSVQGGGYGGPGDMGAAGGGMMMGGGMGGGMGMGPDAGMGMGGGGMGGGMGMMSGGSMTVTQSSSSTTKVNGQITEASASMSGSHTSW